MQIGIDSFVSTIQYAGSVESPTMVERIQNFLEEIELADQVGIAVFGIGEHHRKEFADSAPAVILAASAAHTQRIRLTSAVTVLSAQDPVRVVQEFATLNLISGGCGSGGRRPCRGAGPSWRWTGPDQGSSGWRVPPG